MALAWSRRGAALVALACGCSPGNGVTGQVPSSHVDGGPSTMDTLRFQVDPGLQCADAGTNAMCLAPSQVVSFYVTGPAGTAVSLSLAGDYADAALTTQGITLTSTPTQVTLESSSTTAAFNVIGRVGSPASAPAAQLTVTVATSGSATIEASPIYAGRRNAAVFYATDAVRSTCAEVTVNDPDASTTTWTAGQSGAPIDLGPPAGERIAVEMRLGHYAFGCADVDPLVPAALIAVPVQLYDVPMALSLTDLSATFSYDSDAVGLTGWQQLVAAAVARVEAAFFASASSDGPALLNAMRGAIGIPSDQAEFDLARQAGGWDAATTNWMGAHGPSIGARAATWLTTAEGDAIGPLGATIGSGTSSGTAPVTLATLGALSWVSAGLAQPSPFQWTADATDLVHLSGAIDLASTPLVAHEADAHAALSVTGATDVPSAIALGIDCAGLAASLVGTTKTSYAGCGATCTASLCAAGLAAAWKTASAPAGNGADAVHEAITASGQATVGDLAQPAAVNGAWTGSLSGAGVPSAFTLTGTLVATTPTPDAGTP